ncbi:hypothetical protein A2635_01935 [Candidatus Peribacteria bacterium RIFCSPHIGHO2_01_FULL_51_9]|nr:MAG: hypothetical protein A2635_01935 [Candidatus Peribacteria bacterium RIFCSPHIGHO2_01_FULL_51_9]
MMHSPSPQEAFAPGKIILSGEYAVIFGAPGIAIPSPLKTEVRIEPDQNTRGITIENKSYPDRTYIQRIIELCEAHTGPLKGTLQIDSTIPVGRGMGSSTALVVALARCFDLHKPEVLAIEKTLNPHQSGIDFEVIWQNRPLKFIKGQESESIHLDLSFLNKATFIDTGKPNETTAELVEWVIKQGRNMSALHTISSCTTRLLSGESPLTVFPDHHRAQVQLGIIPQNVQKFINEIEESGGTAKVLGAGGKTGGGGIVLVLHNDPSNLASSYGFHTLLTQHRLCEILG